MNSVAAALCKEIQGAQFAYTQSDEVSVLYTDFQSIESQPWFGGVVAKQISIAASLASSVTTEHCHGERPPTFDARVFTLPDAVEVANYFVWRQRDAVRNSIHMVARAHMSHKECLGKNTDQLQEELFQRFAVNWNDYDDGLKRGRVTENWGDGWKTFAAPHFKAESGNWLADSIPAKASFDG
jgi:tRNA(His) 5'-end guanylyltransferase